MDNYTILVANEATKERGSSQHSSNDIVSESADITDDCSISTVKKSNVTFTTTVKQSKNDTFATRIVNPVTFNYNNINKRNAPNVKKLHMMTEQMNMLITNLNNIAAINDAFWNVLLQPFKDDTRMNIRGFVVASAKVAPTDSNYLNSYKRALNLLLIAIYEYQQESSGSVSLISISFLDWIRNNYDLLIRLQMQGNRNQDINANHHDASTLAGGSNASEENSDTSIATLISSSFATDQWSAYMNAGESGSDSGQSSFAFSTLTGASAHSSDNVSFSGRWNILLHMFPEGLQDFIHLLVEASFQVAPLHAFHLTPFKAYLSNLLCNVYNDQQLNGIVNGQQLNTTMNDTSVFFQDWMFDYYDVLQSS